MEDVYTVQIITCSIVWLGYSLKGFIFNPERHMLYSFNVLFQESKCSYQKMHLLEETHIRLHEAKWEKGVYKSIGVLLSAKILRTTVI